MPLTPFQAELGRRLAANRSEDSYLAGAAPMLAEPNTRRFSQDLDDFHDTPERVAAAYDADRQSLLAVGCTVDPELSQPGYLRAVVRRGAEATKLEWAYDSAWLLRRRGRVRPEDLARLHLAEPVELQALKAEWLGALDGADAFVRRRPPGEAG